MLIKTIINRQMAEPSVPGINLKFRVWLLRLLDSQLAAKQAAPQLVAQLAALAALPEVLAQIRNCWRRGILSGAEHSLFDIGLLLQR